MNRLLFFIIILLACCVNSNQDVPPEIRESLEVAGKNSKELTKAIKHYQASEDSSKLRAVYFLIKNMPDKIHYEGKYIDTMQYFIDHTDVRVSETSTFYEVIKLKETYDSIVNITEPFKHLVNEGHDIKTLSSKYIIEMVDRSFEIWNKSKWKKQVTFNTFLEYVLPYKVSNESPENWRKQVIEDAYPGLFDKVRQIDMLDTAYNFLNDTLNHMFKTYRFPSKILINRTFHNYDRVRAGTCGEFSNYKVYVMRTFGIPCAIDFTAAWGNRKNTKHSWVRPILHYKIKPDTLLFTNVNSKEHLKTTEKEFLFPYNLTIKDVDIQYIKKVPKIYRKMYSLEKKTKLLNKKYPDEIPPGFRDCYMKDVTQEYLDVGTVTVRIPEDLTKINIACLCVFDINGWLPVAIEEVKDNSVTFQNIGKNIVYLPMYYNSGTLYPLDSPFVLTPENERQYFEPNTTNTQSISLKRKYPMFVNIANCGNEMYRGSFSVSNNKKFDNATVIHTITSVPLEPTEFNVGVKESFTYLKYRAHKDKLATVGEFEFFVEEGNRLCKLSKKDFRVIHSSGERDTFLFDNDYLSFYNASYTNRKSITIEFLNPEKRIVKIRYCPRTDVNFIEPGDIYELFYYAADDEWVSLGKKTADDFTIVFDDVPQDALLWLRNLTKGTEERPFLYENGKQVFW